MKKKIVSLLVVLMLTSILVSCSSNADITESKEIKSSVLTIYNCPELEAVLFSKEASGEDFAIKYDGSHVEFESCIFKNEKSSITLDRSITVTGEFNADGEASGWVIMIGDRTLGAKIDESVERGDLVLIKGRVDAEWTKYYNCLYIETESLSKVN